MCPILNVGLTTNQPVNLLLPLILGPSLEEFQDLVGSRDFAGQIEVNAPQKFGVG